MVAMPRADAVGISHGVDTLVLRLRSNIPSSNLGCGLLRPFNHSLLADCMQSLQPSRARIKVKAAERGVHACSCVARRPVVTRIVCTRRTDAHRNEIPLHKNLI